MVFLLTAWKTSSASNPGCLSRRYGKLTLSKVLHFHFQNLSSPACKVACEIPAQPTASTTAWTVVIFTEFELHRER
jgi:hypothetical protein